MAVWVWEGYSGRKVVRGVLEADSRASAVRKLKSQGIVVVKIEEKKEKERRRIFTPRVSLKDIAVFSRQLASLLRSGVPLAEALDTIAKQTRKTSMKTVIASLSSAIKSGKSFSDALEAEGVFPQIYIGMVKAGENSGELDKIMQSLAEYLERQVAIRTKIASALVYPVLVVVVMGFVVWTLLSLVVPKIALILEDTGQTLPFYTRALIFISKVVTTLSPYIIGLLVAFFIFRKRILSIPKVREIVDLAKLKIPLFSRIHLMGCLYRVFSTLATLVKAGVPLVKAIEIAGEVSGNVHIKRVLDEAKDWTVEGRSMSERLMLSEWFPPMIVNMVAVGEKSGEIENMFENIATTLANEIEATVSAITSVLEPVLVVAIGAVVFFIMLSVIMPILQINRTIM